MDGSSTLNLLGCTFINNLSERFTDRNDGYNMGTMNIDGCPSGSFGAAGVALVIKEDGGAITGEAKSYSCDACVR